MEIFWNGSDITGFVRPIHCLHRDGGGGRSDGLDIAFHQAEHWNRWDPQPDDRIEIKLKGYATGTMYLNTSIPDRGKFRVHALGVPRAARRRESRSYENMTLVRPGDVVYIEPGEEHWHGATPDRFMSHIAIQEADEQGNVVTWGEPTTDEEYSDR